MKIRHQLFLTHGLLVLISITIVLVNVLAFKGMVNDSTVTNQLGKLRYISYQMSSIANQIYACKDFDTIADLKKDLADKINHYEKNLTCFSDEEYVDLRHRPTINNLKDICETWEGTFKPLFLELISDTGLGDFALNQINENIDSFVTKINNMITTFSSYAKGKVLSALKINAALVITLVFLTAYSFIFSDRKIRKPISFLIQELKELSLIDDEVSEQLKKLKTDEITEMSQYFNVMIYDQLTKTFNRRSGLAKLNSLIQADNRRHLKLSLCFVDINGLKDVNDLLGHKVGDELIISAAECIKNVIREIDFVIRMGGDEFLIIFKDIDSEMAEKVWDRIKTCYGTINEQENRPYLISVSHGIAEYDSFESSNIEMLITEADNKMYAEKKYLKEEQKTIVIRS